MTLQEIEELAGHRKVSPWVVKLVGDAVAKEREVVANWIMDRGFATGHGDSIVYLLDQLEWQIAKKEREAIAVWLEKECDEQYLADRVRARGQA